jgi:hypothetical protein
MLKKNGNTHINQLDTDSAETAEEAIYGDHSFTVGTTIATTSRDEHIPVYVTAEIKILTCPKLNTISLV